MTPKILIFILLAVGCTNSTMPYAFRPIGFTAQENQLIQEAADEWQTKSNGRYFIMIDENCSEDCSVIRKVEAIDGNDTGIGSCLATVDHYGIRTHTACANANMRDIQSFEIQLK